VGWCNNLWDELCKRVWAEKVYIPQVSRELRSSGQSRQAFALALRDSTRTAITLEELTSIEFSFRFKELAGKYWTDRDPYWQSNSPLRIRFTAEGLVEGFPWGFLDMRWRFVDETGSTTATGSGSFMRVSMKGRDVPTYMVSRHGNWGFILQVRQT
jgi:hypothetical protein